MAGRYVPDAGNIVWLEFDPQAGHEQSGHRPALVLSPKTYNAKTSLMVITSEVQQMFGRYQGTLVTDEGETIQIRDLIGFAEEHHARW